MPIIRYTTPTLKFEYSDVNVTDITDAILSLKQLNSTIIERDLTTATVVHETVGSTTVNYISWTLTQLETSKLPKGTTVQIYCDWKLEDGTRGRSKVLSEPVEDTGKQAVI